MAQVAWELFERNVVLAVALGVLFALAVLWLLFSSSASNKARAAQSTVLLVGPLASGKTALFSKLLYGHVPHTHTSIKENEGYVRAKWNSTLSDGEKAAAKDADDGTWPPADLALSHPLHLVDIPGHQRLRTRALAQFLPTASGVIFTIDASSGLSGKNLRDAADHLHILLSLLSLLASTSSSQTPLPLLILLTKTDLLHPATSSAATPLKPKSLALTLTRAKQALARELERHRLAAAASTTSAGARLEGLEAIPVGAGGTGGGGVKGVLKAFAGSGAAGAGGDKGLLPSDEAEVRGRDAFVVDGVFEWDKVEGSVQWAVGSVKGGEGGVDGVWDWVEAL